MTHHPYQQRREEQQETHLSVKTIYSSKARNLCYGFFSKFGFKHIRPTMTYPVISKKEILVRGPTGALAPISIKNCSCTLGYSTGTMDFAFELSSPRRDKRIISAHISYRFFHGGKRIPVSEIRLTAHPGDPGKHDIMNMVQQRPLALSSIRRNNAVGVMLSEDAFPQVGLDAEFHTSFTIPDLARFKGEDITVKIIASAYTKDRKIWVMGEEQAPITWTIPVIEHGNFVRTDRVVLNHHKKDTTTKKVKTRK